MCSKEGASVFQPSVMLPEEEFSRANGAGDAFAAGFLFGWHEGWKHRKALQLGHAAAAASIRSERTNGNTGTVAECLALAQRWGWRDKTS